MNLKKLLARPLAGALVVSTLFMAQATVKPRPAHSAFAGITAIAGATSAATVIAIIGGAVTGAGIVGIISAWITVNNDDEASLLIAIMIAYASILFLGLPGLVILDAESGASQPQFAPLSADQAADLRIGADALAAYNDEIAAVQLVHEEVTKAVLDQIAEKPALGQDLAAVGALADKTWAEVGEQALSPAAQSVLQAVRTRYAENAAAAFAEASAQ